MIDLEFLLWLTITALLCGGWWRANQAKESALASVKQHCRRLDLQFLDHSVALQKAGLKGGKTGSLRFYRCYSFEFSSTGDERYRGQVVITGNTVESVDFQAHRLPATDVFQDR